MAGKKVRRFQSCSASLHYYLQELKTRIQELEGLLKTEVAAKQVRASCALGPLIVIAATGARGAECNSAGEQPNTRRAGQAACNQGRGARALFAAPDIDVYRLHSNSPRRLLLCRRAYESSNANRQITMFVRSFAFSFNELLILAQDRVAQADAALTAQKTACSTLHARVAELELERNDGLVRERKRLAEYDDVRRALPALLDERRVLADELARMRRQLDGLPTLSAVTQERDDAVAALHSVRASHKEQNQEAARAALTANTEDEVRYAQRALRAMVTFLVGHC